MTWSDPASPSLARLYLEVMNECHISIVESLPRTMFVLGDSHVSRLAKFHELWGHSESSV